MRKRFAYYKEMAGKQEVVFSVQKARDKYDYPRIVLTKQLNMGKETPSLGCHAD